MRTLFIILAVLLLGSTPAHAAEGSARDVILVLDNSGSMRINDPDRLSVAAVTDFIRGQSADTRVAVVVFADSPRLVEPLTPVNADTRGRLLASLGALDFRGQWTEIAAAIERGLYELRINGRDHADKAIVLMTDGIIDTGNVQRDLEKGRWLRERLTAQAESEGVRIFGIAFTEGADYELLQSVADGTGGEYFRALQARELAPVLNRVNRGLADSPVSPADDPGRSIIEPTAPTRSEPAAERLVFNETAAFETLPTEQDDVAGDEAGSTRFDTRAEEGSPWRWLLIVAALMVLGAVGVGILWGDEVARLFQRTARLRREPDDHGPKAVLYDVYDPSDIKRHELGAKPIVIGRVSGSDPAMDYIVVDERTVGRWHATIERRGQSFWIRDEGSVNGTFVNDQRVTAEHPLKHGDMVRVHRHEFEFVIPELFDSDRTMISPEAKMKRPDAQAEGV